MSYKGRYFLGERLLLSLRCVDATGVPTEPDRAPAAIITGAAGLVLSTRVSIRDRKTLRAYFSCALQLDSRFEPGNYQVVYQYTLSGTAYGDRDDFEIVAGGHADGAGLAIHYFRRPNSDFVITQQDSGRVLRRRNPRL